MRLFWWSNPMSPTRMLRTADMAGGPNGQIHVLNQVDIEMALLISEGAQEISWQTAQLLGWPT